MMDTVHDDWKRTGRIYFDGDELAARLREVAADVLIVEADLVHEEVIEGVALRLIGACRGDPINVAIDVATRQGIPVLYTPGRNADAVADLALAYMLCLARHVYEVNAGLKGGTLRYESPAEYLAMYARYGGRELGGLTVGIVGFGEIGRRVARRLRAFDATCLVFDPYVPAEQVVAAGATSVSLERLLADSDCVSVHCPELPETAGLIDRPGIARMKKGAWVVNLARASVVDEDALYDALVEGHLGGAALDVFRQEPVQPENRFVKLPNVLVSPHLGGATADVVRHQSRMIVEGIRAWLAGRCPAHIRNPEVLARSPRLA